LERGGIGEGFRKLEKGSKTLDKRTFIETLHLVQEVSKTAEQPLDKDTVMGYFQDMELSQQQQEMIYQFLLHPQQEEDGIAETNWNREEKSQEEQSEETRRERELYCKLLEGDVSVIEEISRVWLKRVIAVAEEYKERGVLQDDLIQEGNLGLLMGLHELSRQRGRNLPKDQEPYSAVRSNLLEKIKGAMEHYLGEEAGEAMQNKTILAKVSLVHEARKLLTEEEGKSPTEQEIAEYTKIQTEEIRDILSLIKEKQE
jgi:RNA polymerase primary sigma factor